MRSNPEPNYKVGFAETEGAIVVPDAHNADAIASLLEGERRMKRTPLS